MSCALCGGDPDMAIVNRWILEVPIEPPTQNTIASNKGGGRHQYRQLRNTYTSWLKLLSRQYAIPAAQGKRRLIVTRLWARRHRAYDLANLIGGCKPLIDACVAAGLLEDDTPAHLEAYYRQEKSSTGAGGVRLVLEELAPQAKEAR